MIFEMEKCGGCRTCEIACSFHHRGEFNPSVSSIKILDKEGGAGYHVLLLEEDGEMGLACDGCRGLKEPLCMDYCKEKDQLGEMIKALLAKKKAGRKLDMPAGAP
jgi:Fe-S-cluster-containing dehydrogenase component